jgi:predicted permease
MINQLVQVVAPIFVVIAVGYIWSRKGQKFDIEFVTSIAINIGTPCLAFSTLTSLEIQYSMLGVISFSTVIGIGLFGVIGLCILKLFRLPYKGYLPPLMFANIGNMGLPVCLFAYGNEGVALAIVIFAVFMVGQFTIALFLYSGSFSLTVLFKNPIVISVIISVLILVSGYKPPEWISKVTRLLGEITIPMMLLTLGVSLQRMKVFNIGKATLLSIVRIGMGFCVGLLIAQLMGLTGTARGVFILQNSMPVAVFNYLLAERYRRKAAETAELIIVSTILSIITLPLVLSFLKA